MKTRTGSRTRTRPRIECLESRSLMTGGAGYVLTSFNGNPASVGEAVLVQPADGKVVVAGQTIQSNGNGTTLNSSALARYNTDGSPDNTFGGTGQVVTTWTAADVGVPKTAPNVNTQAVVIQPDGKIVTAGVVTWTTGSKFSPTSHSDFALARYNPDGSLDATFNHTGKVATPIGAGTGNVDAFSVAMETVNGVTKIVAAGVAGNGSPNFNDFALIRYNLDGSLDTSFGGTGKVITDFSGGSDYAKGVVIQPDGKIVAAGVTTDTSNRQTTALARYDTDGSLDTTFGRGTGKETLSGVTNSNGVALQPDGKIVTTGTSPYWILVNNKPVNIGSVGVLRVNIDGSLDATFGSAGLAQVDVGGKNVAYAIAVQSDPNLPNYGDILTAGQKVSAASGFYQFAVERLTPNGVLDSTFGSGGIATMAAGLVSQGRAMALQADGRIVVAGFGQTTNDSGATVFLGVARFNADGSVDITF